MAEQEIIQRIKQEINESDAKNEGYIIYLIKQIDSFSDELKEKFYTYLETKEIPYFEYCGFTIEKIMKHTFQDVVMSFITMNKLMKDEEYLKKFPYMSFGKK